MTPPPICNDPKDRFAHANQTGDGVTKLIFEKHSLNHASWLPELGKLPNRWIHCPFDAPTEVLKHAGVQLGKDYPRPIVDLGASRDAALEGYRRIRQLTAPGR